MDHLQWCEFCSDPQKARYRVITQDLISGDKQKMTWICKLHAINLDKYMAKQWQRSLKKHKQIIQKAKNQINKTTIPGC